MRKERIHVGGIAAGEPERKPDRWFDPRTDITKEQWAMINQEQTDNALLPVPDRAKYATLMILAGREITTEDASGIFKHITDEDPEQIPDWGVFSSIACLDHLYNRQLNVTPEHLAKVEQKAEKARVEGNWIFFTNVAKYLFLTGDPPSISEEEWQNIERHKEEYTTPETITLFASISILQTLRDFKVNYKGPGKVELQPRKQAQRKNDSQPNQPRNF